MQEITQSVTHFERSSMASVRQDRRHFAEGSIICDNGVLRLRVVRPGSSLGLVIEARDLQQRWIPMASTPLDGHAEYLDAAGTSRPMHFYAYDPLLIGGVSQGIVLHGQLGEARLTLTTTLTDASTWTQHLLEIEDLVQIPCRQLVHCWQLAPEFDTADIAWPTTVLQADELVETPAAWQQAGSFFAALVPDMEEDDSMLLALDNRQSEQAGFSYGIIGGTQEMPAPPSRLQFAYAMCLDARALPLRGFQEIVRMHGSKDALVVAGGTVAGRHAGDMPALPHVLNTANWLPFTCEGTPEAIAALVASLLAQMEQGDWFLLEDALCWLDRLCFHQHVFEIPGGIPLGSIGSGPAWYNTALWMPSLLLRAYRETGITEYACRARAAISALAAEDQARVLQQLFPLFGDIYVHADYQEAFALGSVEIHSAICTSEVISLEITGTEAGAPLTLVADGVMDDCLLTINGQSLGVISPTRFRAGISLP